MKEGDWFHNIQRRAAGKRSYASAARRQWHRWPLRALRLAAEYEGRRFVSIPDTSLAAICNGCVNRDRVGGSAILSLGSVVSAPLTVSLQDGATASLLYRRKEEQGTARWLNEVRARGNVYLRFGPRVGLDRK